MLNSIKWQKEAAPAADGAFRQVQDDMLLQPVQDMLHVLPALLQGLTHLLCQEAGQLVGLLGPPVQHVGIRSLIAKPQTVMFLGVRYLGSSFSSCGLGAQRGHELLCQERVRQAPGRCLAGCACLLKRAKHLP